VESAGGPRGRDQPDSAYDLPLVARRDKQAFVMTTHLPIALLVLTFAFGCSKKASVDPEEAKRRVAAYVLDQVPAIPNKLDIKLGDKLSLLGYAIEPPGVLKPGQKVKLTFYWQTTGKVEGRYKLFTQILDASGERLMQIEKDAPLRQNKKTKRGGLAVSLWEPGKVYVDLQPFTVPKTKTDKIQIVTGLYNKEGRMPVTQGAKDSSSRALVATLNVLPAFHKPRIPRGLKVPSISVDRLEPGSKIIIDGKLDDAAWQTALPLGPFVGAKSGTSTPQAPASATARLLWDDSNLYLGFSVQEASIIGGFPHGAKDAHLWTKDAVALIVAPNADAENYYEVQISPQNLVFDSQLDQHADPKAEKDGPVGHEEWSAKVKSAVALDGTLDKPEDTDKGYTVELMIPWKSFDKAKKAPPALGDSWALNLLALKEGAGVAWSPLLAMGDLHGASRLGRVRFTAKGWTPPSETTADGGAPLADGGAAPHPSASALRAAPPVAASSGAKIAAPVRSAP